MEQITPDEKIGISTEAVIDDRRSIWEFGLTARIRCTWHEGPLS